MKKLWLVLMACLLAGVAYAQSTGLATDVLPPDWRGDANTTLQAWSFSESNNPALLEPVTMNPYGTPVASVTTTENTGGPLKTFWMATEGGRAGVWRIFGGDYMQLYIPNTDLDNPFKEVWVQLTWSGVAIDHAPLFQTNPEYSSIELIQADPVANSTYFRSVYKIIIEPNPRLEEWIWIQPRDCEVYIDEIVVDTRCIPEPASAMLVFFGAGVGVVIHRARRAAQRR
jgi:hypothetical protein